MSGLQSLKNFNVSKKQYNVLQVLQSNETESPPICTVDTIRNRIHNFFHISLRVFLFQDERNYYCEMLQRAGDEVYGIPGWSIKCEFETDISLALALTLALALLNRRVSAKALKPESQTQSEIIFLE